MDKDVFIQHANYNRNVNEKMDAIIKILSREQWDKDLGGYFHSVRGLCSHLFVCDFNWLKRFSKLRNFTVFNGEYFNREPYSFTEVLFDDMGEYISKRPLLDEKIISLTKELTNADISSSLKYTDSHGKDYEQNFGGLVMRSLNHDTHHRGMISLYLELLGVENDFSAFELIS